MANELTVINGVTKKEKDDTFYYFFPETVIQVFPIGVGASGGNYYRLELENGQEVEEIHFDDITDKLGAATIEDYMDAVANTGAFFNNVNVLVSGGGGGGDASAANQTTQIGLETSIKTNTDNLDTTLSSRASENTLGAVKAKTDNLDTLLSTRASESTLNDIKTPIVDNIDAKLSTLETTLNAIESNTASSGSASTPIDAAGNVPVSSGVTWLNGLQIRDNLPLIYDRVNIGGSTQLYNGTFSRSELRVATSGDAAIAQTIQRFPYFAGSSQQVTLTCSRFGIQADVQKEIGYFSTSSVSPYTANKDGISIYNDGTTHRLRVYRNGTTIHDVAKASWDDPLDGTGTSGMTVDFNNFTVLGFEFLWLGGTGIQFFIQNGYEKVVFHTINHANSFNGVMMSSPLQPIRYELRTSNGVGNLDQICATVKSQGKAKDAGTPFSSSTNSTAINANTVGVKYLVHAHRINTSLQETFARVKSFTAKPLTNDDILIELIYDPVIASPGSLVWGNIANSPLQSASGAAGNPSPTTITGGTVLLSEYGQSFESKSVSIESLVRMGVTTSGESKIIALVVTPQSPNLDIKGGLTTLII